MLHDAQFRNIQLLFIILQFTATVLYLHFFRNLILLEYTVQGCPVNVKHGPKLSMDKVGEDKITMTGDLNVFAMIG